MSPLALHHRSGKDVRRSRAQHVKPLLLGGEGKETTLAAPWQHPVILLEANNSLSLHLEGNRDGKGFFPWLSSVQLRLGQDKGTQAAWLLQASSPAATVSSVTSFCSQWKILYLQLITEITVFYEDMQANSGLSSFGFTFRVPTSFFSTYSQHSHGSHLHFLVFNTNRALKETHYWPSWGLCEQILQISKAVIRGDQAAPGETATSHRNTGNKCFLSFSVQFKWGVRGVCGSTFG